jgi:hypothetical protein
MTPASDQVAFGWPLTRFLRDRVRGLDERAGIASEQAGQVHKGRVVVAPTEDTTPMLLPLGRWCTGTTICGQPVRLPAAAVQPRQPC